MRAWLAPLAEALERGGAAVLVHVVGLKGSGPREVGAQMLVTETAPFGTIGGGELEHAATLAAREMLAAGRAGLRTFALGPELNQCCGGSVTLAFEPFAPADRAWVQKLAAAAAEPEPVIRTLTISETGAMRRAWSQADGEDYSAECGGGSVQVRERVNPAAPSLWLFGAGHVGRAVAHALHPLGFAITWIDGRAGQLPDPPLSGVRQLALAMPELIVDEAPPGAFYLVMTHSHPLDEAICEAVLRREDFGYLGLIGSATKRARFRKRLGEAGIRPELLDRLICPIGLSAIDSKEPAAIAASVAADLLIHRERQSATARGSEQHGRRSAP
jgi:xanthine dehydrogenase accessory factor